MKLSYVSLPLALSLLSLSKLAHADDEEEARRLFEQGRAALSAGQVGEACESFAAAKKVSSNACGVVQNLASCRERQGHMREAYLEFQSLVECADATKQPDRKSFAQARLAELSHKVALLTVTTAGGAALRQLRIDGVEVEGPLQEPQVLDPRKHTLTVDREGCQPLTLTLESLAGQSQSLVLPATCDATTSVSATSRALRPAAPAKKASGAAEEAPRGRWQRVVGWSALSVGAAVVVSAIAPCGLIALNQRDSDPDAARRTAPICTGLGLAGGVVAATGLVFLLTAPSSSVSASRYTQRRFWLAPQLEPGRNTWGAHATLQF